MDATMQPNPFEEMRQAELAPFAGNLSDAGPAAFLVLCSREKSLSDEAREALASTAGRLGYERRLIEWGVVPVAEAARMVEALDPLCVVSTDHAATEELARSYRVALPVDGMGRLWGRPCACLEDFPAQLATPAGKRKAWRVLKELPPLEH